MAVAYMQLLLDLMEERQKWFGKRDEAIREISRLSEMIRATMNMVPAEQVARYEPVFERLEQRPLGLSLAIHACFTEGISPFHALARQPRREAATTEVAETPSSDDQVTRSSDNSGWLTPVQIRDRLKNMGFPFENYKANPLASIHTTLKRMVPGEMEVKTLEDGQKVYRLKSAGEWSQAFAEIRQWLQSDLQVVESACSTVVVHKKDSRQKSH
jgi:hypothetical protein